MLTPLLAWLVFDALVAVLLLTQARDSVLAAVGLAAMAFWLTLFAVIWAVLIPVTFAVAGLRRLGLVGTP